MKFYQFLCQFVKISPYFSGSLEKSLDKVVSRGEKNFSVHKRYMNFFQYRKTPLDEPLYKLSAGRSMVEMLGVLAIIGVLSVGAISGYSKAMQKYKLNKQTEQLNNLLVIMTQYKKEWKSVHEYISLSPFFIKMGLIPENMIKPNDNYLYDVFNNKIDLRNNDDGTWSKIKINYYISNTESFELCQNIMNAAKAFSGELFSAGVYAYASPDNPAASQYLRGDNYCSSNDKCLRDITMDDIYSLCRVCKDSKQQCLFQFLWMI